MQHEMTCRKCGKPFIHPNKRGRIAVFCPEHARKKKITTTELPALEEA